jgi:thioredoxin-related protein
MIFLLVFSVLSLRLCVSGFKIFVAQRQCLFYVCSGPFYIEGNPMKLAYSVIASLWLAAAPLHALAIEDSHAASGINWKKDNDVDAAFAQARAENKPVFLYWGAVWCPPCNQVKATIFNRQDFIERSRSFVPVYLDGDTPNAQKLGARFKVRGYPTMILFKPDGTEITRLPGEVDSERYLQVLTLALNTALSTQDTINVALAGGEKLKNEDWRLLADYSWDDPDQKLVAPNAVPATLLRLSEVCPEAATATRLYLKALANISGLPPTEKAPAFDRQVALQRLTAALTDSKIARDNMDLVTNYHGNYVELLTRENTPERTALEKTYNASLLKLADDTSLSKGDRLSAIDGLVALARLDTPKGELDADLIAQVRTRIAQLDQDTTNPYERQVVVSGAGHTLASAGLLDESDALLKAELKRSHSPYYHMLILASNAKQRGDKDGALSWYQQAYEAAKGPATRLQWGASYINNLIELSPQDVDRIERATHSVLAEVGTTENAFYERNRAALERLGKKLLSWDKQGEHDASLKKIRAELDGICSKLPGTDPQRATCEGVLKSKS